MQQLRNQSILTSVTKLCLYNCNEENIYTSCKTGFIDLIFFQQAVQQPACPKSEDQSIV